MCKVPPALSLFCNNDSHRSSVAVGRAGCPRVWDTLEDLRCLAMKELDFRPIGKECVVVKKDELCPSSLRVLENLGRAEIGDDWRECEVLGRLELWDADTGNEGERVDVGVPVLVEGRLLPDGDFLGNVLIAAAVENSGMVGESERNSISSV